MRKGAAQLDDRSALLRLERQAKCSVEHGNGEPGYAEACSRRSGFNHGSKRAEGC
jgi:hypothetical protein